MAGRALARESLELAACWTSPKVRARETARLACDELGVNFEEVSVLAAGFDREDALELLAGIDTDAAAMVVGHEPDLSQVVYDLTGARVDFKKGGVAGVKVRSGQGELIALLRPLDLETMAGA